MNDVLINTFDELFQLGPTKLSYIQLSFFGTFFTVSLIYFLLSSATGKDPINKLGYKNGMGISLIICGIGCSISYLACIHHSYTEFLYSLIVISSGVTLLQICANPYATILGPSETASSRLNLAQGLNSLGTTIGPIVGSILIYAVFSNGEKTIESVGLTYLLYGGCFIAAAILIMISKIPSFSNDVEMSKGLSVLKNRNLRFGILAIFFYVGSEVAVGSWLGKFSKEPEIMGFDEITANYFLAFFWGGLMIGRLMAGLSLNENISVQRRYLGMGAISLLAFGIIWLFTAFKIDTSGDGASVVFEPIMDSTILYYLGFMLLNFMAFVLGKGTAPRLIVIFCSINAVLLFIGITASGPLAFWAILGTGLFFSVGWSNIFSLSIKGLGHLTSQGSSLLVMAIVGGALLPLIQSQLIENYSVQTSFIVPLIGMLYLIFFGLNGYRRNPTDNAG